MIETAHRTSKLMESSQKERILARMHIHEIHRTLQETNESNAQGLSLKNIKMKHMKLPAISATWVIGLLLL